MCCRILTALATAILLIASVSAQTRTVALTVDDLPYVSADPTHPAPAVVSSAAAKANRRLLAAFHHQHIPVTGFVNQKWVDETASGAGILQAWIAAGLDLGNHTYSHPDFNDHTIEEFEQEVTRGEVGLVPLMRAAGRTGTFFRFPFNHSGDTQEKHDAAAHFLADRGYRQAPCTIETSDYLFNQAYGGMLANHDRAAAARLRADYLAFTAAQIDYFDKLNRQVLGYDAPQIMLIHDNQLNADVIDKLVKIFRDKQYGFVTLTEAEADPAYQAPDTFVTKYGPMWAYRWARERNVMVNGRLEPDPPKWITEYSQDAIPPRRPRSVY